MTDYKTQPDRNTAIEAYELVLAYLSNGESRVRNDMGKTPERYIKMMEELTTKQPFSYTTFDLPDDDTGMIVQGPIYVQSLCAHHTAPFRGEAWVAYIPGERMVGLSKLTRAVQNAGRQFSSQEEITANILNELETELAPKGVAVQLKMQHDCMHLRGPKAHGVFTTTTKLSGAFKESAETRAEFLNATKA